jgi:phosphate transport system substrate-binding protein
MMRKYFNILVYALLIFVVVTCKKSENKEAMLEGKTTLLVDETLKPIVEAQVQVFESEYDAKINIIAKSEAEVIQALVNDSSRIAVLSRTLTNEEMNYFEKKKIFPKTTPFAKDAIALIANKNTKDTLITLQHITDLMKGKSHSTFKGLVFDNPNSSTANYFCKLAGLNSLPAVGVFSFKTNEEVIQYVAQNNGMIGVIGINYIFEPSKSVSDNLDKINVLSVLNAKDNKYYAPTQSNIATVQYPLARDLFVVNAQGYKGLGMGFASFVSSEIGQRITLKSGLVPVRFPSRKIRVRSTITNDKK